MESVSQSASPVTAAVPDAAPAEAPPPAAPRLSDQRLSLDGAMRVRLGLQRRAPRLLLRYFFRHARRISVLVLADLASFWIMRWLVRAVRDSAVLGEGIARIVGDVLPKGILSGWQFAGALLVGLVVMGTYGRGDQRRSPKRLFLAAALATALPLWMTVWTRGLEEVLVQYVLTTILVWTGLGLERAAVQSATARLLGVGHAPFRVLFVGAAEPCRLARASAAFDSAEEYAIVGFADTSPTPADDALGPATAVAQLLHDRHIEVVVLCGAVPDRVFSEVVGAAFTAGCELLSVPRESASLGVEPKLLWRAGHPLIQLSEPRMRGWQLVAKRVMDIAGSLCGLALASPLMAGIAIAIRRDSNGPVLFRQTRIGAGGRRFQMLKFRTMVDGSSEAAHRDYVQRLLKEDDVARGNGEGGEAVFKLVGDKRVTRVGRWLRKTSLDELPQLINVLRGDMSLVGPRPPLAYEVEAYEHWQFDRLGVKPGITGLWQVSGRNRLTYRQMCELDAQYVRTWSVPLDLRILMRTFPVVLTNSGKAS